MDRLDERVRDARARVVEAHESAAALHDRAAEFWRALGRWERSAVEQLKARHDRNDAAFLRLEAADAASDARAVSLLLRRWS